MGIELHYSVNCDSCLHSSTSVDRDRELYFETEEDADDWANDYGYKNENGVFTCFTCQLIPQVKRVLEENDIEYYNVYGNTDYFKQHKISIFAKEEFRVTKKSAHSEILKLLNLYYNESDHSYDYFIYKE